MHQAVLLDEAVAALNIVPNGIYVDCTFGRGGHARLILQRLNAEGRLIAMDRDAQAISAAAAIKDDRLHVAHGRYSDLTKVLKAAAITEVQGVLMDLGVSSPQLNEAQRGFSFQAEGPLDMRMDTSQGITAAQWLAAVEVNELAEVIKNYGEERFAKQIARAIVAARAGEAITTTQQLAEIVAQTIPKREPGQNPATRTFQALRIFINQELEELALTLPQCIQHLAPQGRLVVISFHSLEDRIVKRFMREHSQPQVLPTKLPVRARDLTPPKLRLIGKAMRASSAEVTGNPRARSAVMRVAERA